jgi:hypothetical protein
VPVAVRYGYVRYGRERRVGYDREYEQAPPSVMGPAEVNALLAQGQADERGFTAVMFDLLRRGELAAEPVSVERKTWLGLRTEEISVLEISVGESGGTALTPAESEVMSVVRRILHEGPAPLSEFRTQIRSDASANHSASRSHGRGQRFDHSSGPPRGGKRWRRHIAVSSSGDCRRVSLRRRARCRWVERSRGRTPRVTVEVLASK